MNHWLCSGILFLILLGSCRNPTYNELPIPDPTPVYKNYIHMAHVRTDDDPKMDSVVEAFDYSNYDMLWLGGDLMVETSKKEEYMDHLDSIFDVSNPATLWALGNHDYDDVDRVATYTGRPSYYVHSSNGLTVIVLDTQDSFSNIIGAQRALVDQVLDTIQTSTHLVLLHHKLIWMYDHEELESRIQWVSNAGLGTEIFHINSNNFNAEIYPKLVEVKARGIEVLCIGGDIGYKKRDYQYITPDGIYFMASGMNGINQPELNKALVLTHDIANGEMTWEFILMNEL